MFRSRWFQSLVSASVGILSAIYVPAGRAQHTQKRHPPGQSTPAARQSPKRIGVEIPHLIFVSVRVNNSEPLRFILDSASTWTMLDAGQAAALGLKTEGRRTIEGAGENALEITFAKDVSVDMAGVKLIVENLAVTPINSKPYVGLIGSDLFKKFVVEIDYERQAVSLFDPRGFKYVGPGESIPFELRDDIPFVPVSIATGTHDPIDARLDVDTGAAQTILLTRSFIESNKMLESTRGMLRIGSSSLGGKSSYLIGRARSVKVGRFVFEDWLTGFWQDQRGAGASDSRDGIVGNGLLKRFKVIFDYSRKRMILEPTGLLGVPFDYDWCGFNIVADGKDFKIEKVLRGTSASDAGLQAGDVILAVDGKPSSELKLNQLRGLFKQDGRERLLNIKRDKDVVVIKLPTIQIP